MKRSTTYLAAAALAMAAGPSFAEEPIRAGDGELYFSGGIVTQDSDERFSTYVRYGHFVAPGHQVGLSAGLYWSSSDFFDDDYDALLGAFYNYHFVTDSKLVPFIGGGVEGLIGESGGFSENFNYLAQAGVKYFVNENIAINATVFHYWDNSRFPFDATGVRWGFSWFTKGFGLD